MEIKIPKKVCIEIDVDFEKENKGKFDNKKEIEGRRKVFSGEDFKW